MKMHTMKTLPTIFALAASISFAEDTTPSNREGSNRQDGATDGMGGHHSAPAASVDGRFLNIAILDLPPRFIAGIPTDNRVNLLRNLSSHQKDRRLDYSKGYLNYSSDNVEESAAIEANCRFHIKLLPNTYSDNPKVLVIMVRNVYENEPPSADDTVVLDRDRRHGKWVDITDSVLPAGIERNRFFEPFGDLLSFHVKARKLYSTAPGRPRSYRPGALEADIRWDSLRQKFVRISPNDQDGADQPATAVEPKVEGGAKPDPKSEGRTH